MKKIFSLVLVSGLLAFNVFALLEGQLAVAATSTNATTSTVNYNVTLDVTSQIRLTCEDVKNIGSISGLTGGSVNGTVDCNVATNNATGYQMWLHATGTPAMAKVTDGTKTFADYTAGTVTSTWLVAPNASAFGFTISASADAVNAFKNAAGVCGSGSVDGTYCWTGFNGTTDINVLSKSAETSFAGVTSTFKFQAESGAANSQATGHYSSTVVATAAIQ
jgi:hypothetical protein